MTTVNGTKAPLTVNVSSMNGSSKEEIRLGEFQKDCLHVACLKGFKYFSAYPGGRTSLFISIKTPTNNDPPPPQPLARNEQTKKEMEAMGYSFLQSPKENEAVFLVSGYRRFLRPYVWLWSSNVQVDLSQQSYSGEGPIPEDPPVPLEALDAWGGEREVKVWEVIAELVKRVVQPEPLNPFEVDYSVIQNRPLSELTYLSAGVVHFLRKLYLHHTPAFSDVLYNLVLSDVQHLLDIHFLHLARLISTTSSTIPSTTSRSSSQVSPSLSSSSPSLPSPQAVFPSSLSPPPFSSSPSSSSASSSLSRSTSSLPPQPSPTLPSLSSSTSFVSPSILFPPHFHQTPAPGSHFLSSSSAFASSAPSTPYIATPPLLRYPFPAGFPSPEPSSRFNHYSPTSTPFSPAFPPTSSSASSAWMPPPNYGT